MTAPSRDQGQDVPAPTLGRLTSHAGIVTAGNLLFAALGFLSNTLLARVLGEQGFAVMARALAAFAICQELFGKSLSWALVRIAAQRARERGGAAEAEVVAATRRLHGRWGAALLVVYVPCALLVPSLTQGAQRGEELALLAAGASAWLTNYSWHALAVCQLREDWSGYALLTAGGGLVRLLGYAALWALAGLTVWGAICAHVVTSALTALWSLGVAERRVRARGVRAVDERELRAEIGAYARPVVVATTLGTLAAQIDFFLVSLFRANAAVSHYRVAALLNTALELVVIAVITVLAPGAGRATTRRQRRASLALATWLAALVGALALATWPCASLLVVPFGAEYAPAADLYVVLLFGTVLNALTHPLSVSFFSEDRPERFMWLHGGSLVFLVIADLIVLPGYGALGAAWVKVGMRALQAIWILAYVATDIRAE